MVKILAMIGFGVVILAVSAGGSWFVQNKLTGASSHSGGHGSGHGASSHSSSIRPRTRGNLALASEPAGDFQEF